MLENTICIIILSTWVTKEQSFQREIVGISAGACVIIMKLSKHKLKGNQPNPIHNLCIVHHAIIAKFKTLLVHGKPPQHRRLQKA